jgi:uncharacterized protein (TIGR00297 family)
MCTLNQATLVFGGIPARRSLWIAAFVTLAFAALARWIRGVSVSGAVAGAAVCFVIYAGAGPGGFAGLAALFALTWIATRFGYRRKQRLGTAENREGRTASQVLANLAVAAACAAIFAFVGKRAFLIALAAALSEAAADTVSSELGQAHNATARLVTTWEEVPAGTDGGVTGIGTLGGMVAAVLVGIVCALAGVVNFPQLRFTVVAALLGMTADSYMGALLERRKLLTNDWVNFLSTLTAAGVAWLLA